MNQAASYVLSEYSFIFENSFENLVKVGSKSMNGNPIPSFDEDLIIDLCSNAQEIFEKEDNILHLNGDLIIVGDIHGSFNDLLRIIHFYYEHHKKVLFLGDYVNKGNFSLECITLLLAFKVSNPDTFYLIRGNHEFDSMCSQYGFKNEIINYYDPKKIISHEKNNTKLNKNEENQKNNEYSLELDDTDCYKYTEKLYESFMKTFSYMPIAAIVNRTTFCIHGGLSPQLEKVEDLNTKISRPIDTFDENQLFSDLLWSDPSDKIQSLFGQNPRGRGYFFNGLSTINFLRENSLKKLIRSHECVIKGSSHIFDGKCITVFSASCYDSKIDNYSAILELFERNDKINTVTFPPIERLQKSDALYYKVKSLDLIGAAAPLSQRIPITASNSSINLVGDQSPPQKKFGAQQRLVPIAVPSVRSRSRRMRPMLRCPSAGNIPKIRPVSGSISQLCPQRVNLSQRSDHAMGRNKQLSQYYSDNSKLFSDVMTDD